MYTYCHNDPIQYVDPTGHYVSDWDKEHLSPSEIKQLEQYGKDWNAANKAGNQAGKDKAHENAEKLRDKYRNKNEVGTGDGNTVTVTPESNKNNNKTTPEQPKQSPDPKLMEDFLDYMATQPVLTEGENDLKSLINTLLASTSKNDIKLITYITQSKNDSSVSFEEYIDDKLDDDLINDIVNDVIDEVKQNGELTEEQLNNLEKILNKKDNSLWGILDRVSIIALAASLATELAKTGYVSVTYKEGKYEVKNKSKKKELESINNEGTSEGWGNGEDGPPDGWSENDEETGERINEELYKSSKLYKHEVDLIAKISSIDTNKFNWDIENFKKIYEKNKAIYEEISKKTGIPPELIAAIHYRESGCDFNTYLHNGDPLGKPTTNVPKGKYFDNFIDAAVDALSEKKSRRDEFRLNSDSDDIAAMMAFAESYNGLGYYKYHKDTPSPYVYSGTNVYIKGKYKSDGEWDPDLVDAQPGVYILITSLKK